MNKFVLKGKQKRTTRSRKNISYRRISKFKKRKNLKNKKKSQKQKKIGKIVSMVRKRICTDKNRKTIKSLLTRYEKLEIGLSASIATISRSKHTSYSEPELTVLAVEKRTGMPSNCYIGKSYTEKQK